MNYLGHAKIWYLKGDFAIEGHKRVLKCLLNSILKGTPHIESITLENTEIPRDDWEGKTIRLDILAKTNDGTVLTLKCSAAIKVLFQIVQYFVKAD